MVPVGVTKAVADETVLQEPEPDAIAIIAENIQTEFEYKVKAKEKLDVSASSSKKAVNLKTINMLEKPIYSRKVATISVNAITMDKYWFAK